MIAVALLCTCRRRGPSPPAQHRAHRFFVAVTLQTSTQTQSKM
jgi:phosphatidylethanolamine-binding protein (PEBP) family uncharacterized protein